MDSGIAEQLAEIGVILLMFGVGLQFHVEELLAVRRVAVPGAIGQSVVATVLGAALASSFGWSTGASVIFGIALAVASTVVVVRVLSDHNVLHTPAGHIAVGWLVVEDVLTVIALVLLPALFGEAQSDRPLYARRSALTALKVGALVAFTAIVGSRVIPRCSTRSPDTRSRELFTLTVLVIALGIAVGSARIFGVSMALGAFLAGMVVGRSDYSLRAASDALPMRDAFAVLFFVSVGMLLDPASLFDAPWFLAGTLAIVLIANPLVAFAIMWALAAAVQDGGDGGGCARADRRVLLHPLDPRPRARPAHARGDQYPGRGVDRVDHRQSGPVPDDRSDRQLGGAPAAACAATSTDRD